MAKKDINLGGGGFLESLHNTNLTPQQTARERLENLPNLPEAQRLSECEAVIQEGIEAYYTIGQALLLIQQEQLYKEHHNTFEDYCRSKWNLGRSTAYQWIDSYKVVENVRSCGQIPANESQARQLAALPPEQQKTVWQEVIEESQANSKEITAKQIAEKVKEIKGEDTSKEPNPKKREKKEIVVTGEWVIENNLVDLFTKLGLGDIDPDQEFLIKRR